MVGRPGVEQISCNAGEVSPDVAGNTGLKQYFAAMALMRNVEPVPQGGFALSPRSKHVAPVRAIVGPTFTVGGEVSASLTTATTILEWSFTPARGVTYVDVVISASLAQEPIVVLEARAAADAQWHALTGFLRLSTLAQTRRLGFPPGVVVDADRLRLRFISAPTAATIVTIGALAAWSDNGSGPLVARPVSMDVETGKEYTLVFSEGNVDVFLAGVFVGCAQAPLQGIELPDVKFTARDETLLVWRQSAAPLRFLRHGADWDWSWDTAPFTHVPEVDLGGVYVSVNDIWEVLLQWSVAAPGGNAFTLSVDGVDTPRILIADFGSTPDWPGTAANVAAALALLPEIEPGFVVTASGGVGASGSAKIIIEFSGAGNAGNQYTVGGAIYDNNNMSLRTARAQRGKHGGEALMSASRGWPTTGKFFQQRLVMGGFPARKSALLASRAGEFFDQNIETPAALAAVLVDLDTDGGEEVVHLAGLRHLVVHTSKGEYYLSDRALAATQPPNFVRSSRNGTLRRVAPVEQESGLLYFNRTGAVLHAAQFSAVSEIYDSQPLSLLASHLIREPVAAALQAASSSTDADRLWQVNADGEMTIWLLIRNQDVAGACRWATDGQVRGVSVDGANRVHVIVDRPVGAGTRTFLETLTTDVVFDAATALTFASPTTAITGLAFHEGRQVWALSEEGWLEGPYTVTGGQITLRAPVTNLLVGRWTPPSAKPLDLVRDIAARVKLNRPARVFEVEAEIIDTTSLAVAANGGPARDVPLARFGDALDTPTPPFSGRVVVGGLSGFSPGGAVEFTQTRPGRLHLRSFIRKART